MQAYRRYIIRASHDEAYERSGGGVRTARVFRRARGSEDPGPEPEPARRALEPRSPARTTAAGRRPVIEVCPPVPENHVEPRGRRDRRRLFRRAKRARRQTVRVRPKRKQNVRVLKRQTRRETLEIIYATAP